MKNDQLSGPGDSSDLLIGVGVEFEGKLTFKGTVRIDSRFIGSIFTDDTLIVGERARVEAEITCGTVIVHGQVTGNIKAKSGVELRHPAQMRGDIESPSLVVEQGALFQGAIRMGQAGSF